MELLRFVFWWKYGPLYAVGITSTERTETIDPTPTTVPHFRESALLNHLRIISFDGGKNPAARIIVP